MKKIILGLVLMSSFSVLYGQELGPRQISFDVKAWEELKKEKIYVVLGNSAEFDTAMVNAIKQNWKFNNYEFIDSDKYKTLQISTTNYFLFLSEIEIAGPNGTGSYKYIYLSQGNKVGQLGHWPPMAAVLIGNDSKIGITQLPVFIKTLQLYCDLVHDGTVKSIKEYKKMIVAPKTPSINTKTLYVLKKDLNNRVKSAADIKKGGYTGDVVITSESELNERIKKGEDVNLFFNVENSGIKRSSAFVYNIKSGELLYSGFNVISKAWPKGIIVYHFKKWK